MSNGFSAADMSTAAANGHAEGYQAGYADAVKAYEAGKPAAAQEAVAYLDIGAGGYLDLGSNLPEVQLLALPKGRHALGIIGTYGIDGYAAAPVAAAPVVDGRDVRSAIAGIEGSVAVGSDGEWVSVRRTARDAAVTALRNVSSDCANIYAAYAEAKASTPAAPGIDLAGLREMLDGWKNSDYPLSYEGQCAQKALNACIADVEGLLTDASPKGDDVHDDRFPRGLIDAIEYADNMEEAAEGLYQHVFEHESDGDDCSTVILQRVLGYLKDSPKGGTCGTCNGHGMIGGLLPAGGGYESEPCPDCSPKDGSDARAALAVAYRHLDVESLRVSHCNDLAIIHAAMQATSAEVGA